MTCLSWEDSGRSWEKLGDEDAEKNTAPRMHGAEVENLTGSRT